MQARQEDPDETDETAPLLSPETTAVQSVRAWIDLMRAAEKLMLAGLTHQVGPDAACDAHRQWCAERFERHGEHLAALARQLRCAGD